MSERRRRGKHRGAATGPARPMAVPARRGPSPQLFISKATVSGGARRRMVPLIIVQFVMNTLLAALLLLNNRPQSQASPVGSSSASPSSSLLSASLASTWSSNSAPDSPDELQREASGVKFELFRGDKSSASASSSSSSAVQTPVHLHRRARPRWRWLLANELEREVRAPQTGRRRHANLLTIDEDEDENEDERADYNADNENSARSRVFRPELLARSMAREQLRTRPGDGRPPPRDASAESDPPLAADLLKLKRRRRHHAHQEYDLSGGTSLISALDQNGASGSAPPPPSSRPQQIKTREQIQIAEQTYRNKLMELKQKYMTNRAINDLAYYVLLTIYAALIIFGTISNSLICMTVILKPKILSPRNIFIVNLAGSDLLLCVFTMPFSFIEISMKMWQMGLVPCKLVSALQATSIFVSTISITAIALDRYKVIVYPTHQETASGARGAFLLLASVWVGALLLSLPLFWFRTVENYDNLLPQNGSLAHHGLRSSSGQQQQHQAAAPGPDSGYHNNSGGGSPTVVSAPLRPAALNQHDTIESIDFCVEKWPFDHGRGIYSVISMIFQYVLPITIVGVVYTKISHKLQKRLIRRQRLTQLECQQKRQLNLIKRTHTMLISVSLVFGLSWLPLNLLNVISDFSPSFRQLLDDQSFRVIFAVCHLIGCSSACSNPVLYGFLNENFRKELRQVYNYHARRLVRLLRRLIGCRCCWLTRKLSQRCFGSRIDVGDLEDDEEEEEEEDEDGVARRGDTCKQRNNGEPSELAIKFKGGDSLSGGHAHSHDASSSSYSVASSSSASSGFDSSASSGSGTPSRVLDVPPPPPPAQPASSLSLNLQTDGHAHHSMCSLPNEIDARALAGSTTLPRVRTTSGGGQVVADLKITELDGTTEGQQIATEKQRSSFQQSMLDTARRLSYQTIASSRHTMGGRTMRLCLCISGSSSAETLGGGATPVPVAINGINLNRMPPAPDFVRADVAQLETRIDDDDGQEEATRKLNRKLRRREKRRRQKEELAQLECQCQCHSAARPESEHSFDASRGQATSVERQEGDSKSERYLDLASETAAGAREQERQRTKFDSKSLDDRQTGSAGLAAGRRVWLRFLSGGGGGGGADGAKSSGDLAAASKLRVTDGHLMIDKKEDEEDEKVKMAPSGHCSNCKHSSAASRSGGVTSSTSLERPAGAGETGQKSHRGKRHRDRAQREPRTTEATIEGSATKPTQLGLGALPSMGAARQRDAATATKRRPLMSSLMSSFRLTRSSASSQDGGGGGCDHHQVPLKKSNAAAGDQFQLPTLGLSRGGGGVAPLAVNPISPSRADKRHAEQHLSASGGGGGGKQVGTVYLSIEMPSRHRGDSLVSTSGRERSTSVVVLDCEEDQDETRAGREAQPIGQANEENALEPDEQQVASSDGKPAQLDEKEIPTLTTASQHNSSHPTAGCETEVDRSQVILRSSHSTSASSPSSTSSSFTSACLLRSSSLFSYSCTCSTASSCSQTTSTNCHLTVGASANSSKPQLIDQSGGTVAEGETETAANGGREKRRSQSYKRSSLALMTPSQSEQDLEPRHGEETGVRIDRERAGHELTPLDSLDVADAAPAASEAQVGPRARSATAGTDLSAAAEAACASPIIGRGHELQPEAATVAPSMSDAVRTSLVLTKATSSCSIYTTTGRPSLTSCCELFSAEIKCCESRKDDATTQKDERCNEESDRNTVPASLCNGLLLTPTTNRRLAKGHQCKIIRPEIE